MKTEKRWIKSLAAEAAKCEQHQMPWARGARRQAMIARRKAAEASSQPDATSSACFFIPGVRAFFLNIIYTFFMNKYLIIF